MNYLENKLEIGIGVFAALLIGGIFSLFNTGGRHLSISDSQVNYEMPRPKSDMVSEFDLEGREIQRNLVDPYAKKSQKDQKAEVKNNAPQSVKNAKTQQQKTKTVDKKKSQFESRVVGGQDSMKNNNESLIENNNYQPSVTISFDSNNKSNPPVKDKDIMSPDQWRSLISAQPTKENIAKLVEAFGNKDVDSATFYQIIRDLLASQKADDQTLGLTALQSFPSVKSFITVVQAMDHLDPKVKIAAHDYLLTYNQSKNLGILALTLQTNDMEVVSTAAEVIMAGLERIKSQSSASNPNAANTSLSTATDYNRFIPIFQRWQNTQDVQLQNLATSALAQLQAG